MNITKKKINICCIDLYKGQIKWLKKVLEDNNFIIQYDYNNPDYLIFNFFKYLKKLL